MVMLFANGTTPAIYGSVLGVAVAGRFQMHILSQKPRGSGMTYTIDQIKAAIINCTASGDSSPVDPMTLAFIEEVIAELEKGE